MTYQSKPNDKILEKLNELMKTKVIYPPKEKWFRALELTPLEKVKVVILGQDPYHGVNEANGLCFSVGIDLLPPSLKNIYKELESDLGIVKTKGDLSFWAEQGVLLLNTILTVEKDQPLSHKHLGWQDYTLDIIKEINALDRPIVFCLWGSHARSYKKYLNNQKHLILESAHPSPLSSYRGFSGSKPFSQINQFLSENGVQAIDFSR